MPLQRCLCGGRRWFQARAPRSRTCALWPWAPVLRPASTLAQRPTLGKRGLGQQTIQQSYLASKQNLYSFPKKSLPVTDVLKEIFRQIRSFQLALRESGSGRWQPQGHYVSQGANGAGKTDVHRGDELRHRSHTLHKKQLKMNQGSKWKTQNYEAPRNKMGET